ncbi:MAG: hypothetical protein HC786_11555 [Richelia sp. CSU_2_1]|nr:hypothetical protein [Richelia sp. CSU_2_1]
MNIWIITTGSSDVQLTTNDLWHDWYYDGSPVKRNCKNLEFKPTQVIEDNEETYRIAPRVLGKVYEAQPEEVWQYLEFPLLRQFSTQLQDKKITKIYILVTDQTEKYNEEREDIRCPYWQDTCELQPIFERYFKEQEEFRDVKLIPIYLSPEKNKPGLDDWNSVLEIVRTAFSEEIKVEPDTVYVSHQAGTPAISSAVQFMSLARFGKKVKFLVSNEYEKKPLDPIDSSEYLKGIKFEQAKELLRNHDYAGVKLLVNDYLDSETKILLDAAILWNFAKFDEFAQTLVQHSDGALVKKISDRTKKENWWWTAYEEGYLAVVRLDQKNTVEAMFHSFRAVEGLIREWAVWKYEPQIKKSNPKQPRTLYFHDENINMSTQLQHWFERFYHKEHSNVGLFGEPLFELLKASHSPGKWHNNSDIKTVAKITKEERNSIFHQLRGLQEPELFAAWDTDNPKDWEKRVLSCLNFISGEKFDLSTECLLEKTSLMSEVHNKLKNEIDL